MKLQSLQNQKGKDKMIFDLNLLLLLNFSTIF